MVVVWGRPASLSGCEETELSWDKCLDNCTNLEDCVTTFLDGSENCFICKFKLKMLNVEQTTKEDKVKVGFKIHVDTSVDKCPKGENPPTFGNLEATGDASTTDENGSFQNYTISYTGSGWQFETYYKRKCIEGFAFSKRPNIDWCLAVGYVKGENISYSRGPGICQQYGSNVQMSGVASAEEVEGIVYQLCKRRKTDDAFYAFVDGKRTPECQETPSTPECMSIQGFSMIDKSIQNLDAYQFMTDASAGAESGKQCIVMFGDVVNDGKVDFVECESNFDFMISGVVCGHEAFTL